MLFPASNTRRDKSSNEKSEKRNVAKKAKNFRGVPQETTSSSAITGEKGWEVGGYERISSEVGEI